MTDFPIIMPANERRRWNNTMMRCERRLGPLLKQFQKPGSGEKSISDLYDVLQRWHTVQTDLSRRIFNKWLDLRLPQLDEEDRSRTERELYDIGAQQLRITLNHFDYNVLSIRTQQSEANFYRSELLTLCEHDTQRRINEFREWALEQKKRDTHREGTDGDLDKEAASEKGAASIDAAESVSSWKWLPVFEVDKEIHFNDEPLPINHGSDFRFLKTLIDARGETVPYASLEHACLRKPNEISKQELKQTTRQLRTIAWRCNKALGEVECPLAIANVPNGGYRLQVRESKASRRE